MRTKSLLLAAALLSFAGASAMAQVYSVNAVGFVNVPLEAGKFKMVGNPLNTTDNTLNGLMKTVPEGTLFYKYGATGFSTAIFDFGEWAPNFQVNPGEGGFIKAPSATTITFVGEVLQGEQTIDLKQGFQIISSKVPQALSLSAMSFPGDEGDIIYFYRNNAYQTYIFDFGEWTGPDNAPTPAVAEAFWVKKVNTKPWTRTFTVN